MQLTLKSIFWRIRMLRIKVFVDQLCKITINRGSFMTLGYTKCWLTKYDNAKRKMAVVSDDVYIIKLWVAKVKGVGLFRGLFFAKEQGKALKGNPDGNF